MAMARLEAMRTYLAAEASGEMRNLRALSWSYT